MGEGCVRPLAAWGHRGLRRALAVGLLAGTAMLLAACGGGGGGGGTPTDTFSIAFDKTSIEATWPEGTTPPSPTLQATGQGQTSRTLYVGAATPANGSDPNIARVDVVLNGTNATVSVVPAAGLAVGRHAGTLLLRACYDNACAQQVNGSPATISYAFTVQASPLKTDPAALDMTAFTGEQVQRSFTVLGTTAASPLKVTPRDAWLHATVRPGIGDPSVLLDATAGPVGTLTTAVDIENNGLKFTMPVTLHSVPQRLTLRNKRLAMTAVQGRSVCSDSLFVDRQASGATGSTATTTDAWLGITAQGPSIFSLQAVPLPPGSYTGSVIVRSGTDTEVLPVSCDVISATGAPTVPLALGRPRITLWAPEGGTSATESLALQAPSWNRAVQSDIAYAQGQGWLRVTATAQGDLQVSANAAGLARGVYDATVTVKGGYPAQPVSAGVRLTVGDGLAVPAPQTIIVDSDSTQASLSGTLLPVGPPALARWTATTSTPWLRLTTASGDMRTPLAYVIDSTLALQQPGYTDVPGTITIQATTASGVAVPPVTSQFVLRRELGELTAVGPGTVIAGKAVDVIVRGRGFSRTRFADSLQLNGQPVLSATVINDGAIAARLPALAAGDAVLTFANSLGVDTGRLTLRAVAAAASPAAALDTGGSPRSIVHDPRRRQVFVANPALGAIQRWREQSGAWVADKLEVTDLADIALSTDGGTLLATRTRGQVLLIDPATLALLSTHDAPARLYPLPKMGSGLAVTNDGKLWLTTIDSKPLTFDLATRTFAEARFDGVQTAFNGGPWFMAARNGERIVAVQSTTGAPMLSMDASVGQWRANPVDLGFFYWSLNSLGDTGRRLLVMGGVWQADYAAIGRQLLPDAGWIDGAAVLSPEGDRLYVFALPPSWNLAGGTVLPRIYVFDTSAAVGTNAALPLLNTIEVPQYPTCRVDASVPGECLRPAMNISADGTTLFIAGEARLVVLPLVPPPQTLPTLAVTLGVQRLVTELPSRASAFIPLTATINPRPTGSLVPFIVADKPVFIEGATSVTTNADGSYGVIVRVRSGLAVGTYSGTLTLLLCTDSACTAQYPLTGHTLPYTVTVLPPLAVTMQINGVNVAVPEFGSAMSTPVRAGDVITVTAAEPTTWSLPEGTIIEQTSTPTRWTATVGPKSGLFWVNAASVAHPANTGQLIFLVVP